MSHKGILFAAALSSLAALTPASAEMVPAIGSPAANPVEVTPVQFYEPGYYGDYGYYGGPYDGGGLFDVPADVIGGTEAFVGGVLGNTLGGGYGYGYGRSAIVACERRFRSFDPATGTYRTYSGERVMCPYLQG
jgi:BA14K-like protein